MVVILLLFVGCSGGRYHYNGIIWADDTISYIVDYRAGHEFLFLYYDFNLNGTTDAIGVYRVKHYSTNFRVTTDLYATIFAVDSDENGFYERIYYDSDRNMTLDKVIEEGSRCPKCDIQKRLLRIWQ